MDPNRLIPGRWYRAQDSGDRLLRFERQDGDGYIFSMFKGVTPEDPGDLLRVITIYNVSSLDAAGSA